MRNVGSPSGFTHGERFLVANNFSVGAPIFDIKPIINKGEIVNNEIKEKLFSLADTEYKEFSSALIPGEDKMLGVRLPELRKIAKEIAKGNWREFLSQPDDEYFEYTLLQGMVIGAAKMELSERFDYISAFVPRIHNWSVCDSFCVGLKFAKKYQSETWEFLLPYLGSTDEYSVRFGVVMLLVHFINKEYIDRVIAALDNACQDYYYTQMAVAWALSVCYVNFPEKTMSYLCGENKLTKETYLRTLQKIVESNRVSKDEKDKFREMKKAARL